MAFIVAVDVGLVWDMRFALIAWCNNDQVFLFHLETTQKPSIEANKKLNLQSSDALNDRNWDKMPTKKIYSQNL